MGSSPDRPPQQVNHPRRRSKRAVVLLGAAGAGFLAWGIHTIISDKDATKTQRGDHEAESVRGIPPKLPFNNAVHGSGVVSEISKQTREEIEEQQRLQSLREAAIHEAARYEDLLQALPDLPGYTYEGIFSLDRTAFKGINIIHDDPNSIGIVGILYNYDSDNNTVDIELPFKGVLEVATVRGVSVSRLSDFIIKANELLTGFNAEGLEIFQRLEQSEIPGERQRIFRELIDRYSVLIDNFIAEFGEVVYANDRTL